MNNRRITFWQILSPLNIIITYFLLFLICKSNQVLLPLTRAASSKLLIDAGIIYIPLLAVSILQNLRTSNRLHLFSTFLKWVGTIFIGIYFFSLYPNNSIVQLVVDIFRKTSLLFNRIIEALNFSNHGGNAQALALLLVSISFTLFISLLITVITVFALKDKQNVLIDIQEQEYKSSNYTLSMPKLSLGFLYKAIP